MTGSFLSTAKTITTALALHSMTEATHHQPVDIKLFEIDIVPVRTQIMQMYGPVVAAELVGAGILEGDDHALDSPSSIGTPSPFQLWPVRDVNNVVVVSYQFDASFIGNKTIIRDALRGLEQLSGVVQFAEKDRTPYIRIMSQDLHREEPFSEIPACWSYVGYQQMDEQELNLGPGCIVKGFVQHMFLHALGLWHEQSRWDRDDYLDVVRTNIWPGLEYELEKRVVLDTLGSPYDYGSMMHDDATDYSKGNGSITMVAPEPIGQLDAPSNGDIMKLRLLYQCESGPRDWSHYEDNKCTADCQCWENALGCSNNDDACQGNLVCRSNRCVYQPSPSRDSLHFAVVVALSFGFVWILIRGARSYKRRQKYQMVGSIDV